MLKNHMYKPRLYRMRTQLLCTFTTQKNLEQTTHDISKNFNVVFEKIYVLQNENKTNELICTYNVDQDEEINYNDVKKNAHWVTPRLGGHGAVRYVCDLIYLSKKA